MRRRRLGDTDGAVSAADTLRVLGYINQRHDANGRLEEVLGEDARGSTWAIRDSDGRPAVLKWTMRRDWAPQVMRAAATVAHARAHGYPTPEWLAYGTTEDGLPYDVQDWVVGAPPGGLDVDSAALITGLVTSQEGIAPVTEQNWSQHVRRVVFANAFGLHDRVAQFSRTTGLAIRVVDELCARHVELGLPDDDLVHGDLSWQNILIDGDRISGVVDAESLGRGTRVIDLVTPLRQAYVLGSDELGRRHLLDAATEATGPEVLVLCIGCDVINILAFGIDHWPDRVDPVARKVQTLLEDVARM